MIDYFMCVRRCAGQRCCLPGRMRPVSDAPRYAAAASGSAQGAGCCQARPHQPEPARPRQPAAACCYRLQCANVPMAGCDMRPMHWHCRLLLLLLLVLLLQVPLHMEDGDPSQPSDFAHPPSQWALHAAPSDEPASPHAPAPSPMQQPLALQRKATPPPPPSSPPSSPTRGL